MALAYQRNRTHLAPWDPERGEEFYTAAAQQKLIDEQLAGCSAGTFLPLVLTSGTEIIGRLNLAGITRGAFQSAGLGYWIDETRAGGGLMTAPVRGRASPIPAHPR